MKSLTPAFAALAFGIHTAGAAPVVSPWPAGTAPAGVAAASLSGYYAIADSSTDTVEVRGIAGETFATVTRAQMTGLLTWMNLDSSADGPSALAFSDSGRLLFILVHDATEAPSGAGDAVLRFDTQTGQLTTFARLNVSTVDGPAPDLSLAHFAGRLYVGLPSGQVAVYRALANDTAGPFLSFITLPLPAAAPVVGLAVDRVNQTLYASAGGVLFRYPILTSGPVVSVGSMGGSPRSLAWSDHYGGVLNAGLYWADTGPYGAPIQSIVRFVTPAMARGTAGFSPGNYLVSTTSAWTDAAMTADGQMLVSSPVGAARIRDDSDTRLGYSAFVADEFAQVVRFGRGLISPDGEPAGWVIDADTDATIARFHPATPDAAAWTVLLLLMNDRINADPLARGQVRTVLARYAGRLSGPAPSRTADGIFRHWIDPVTGGVKPGWDPEFATLSTMKIVAAAQRAADYYPDDASIQVSARSIICRVKNWNAYMDVATGRIAYKGLIGGGADFSAQASAFNESVLFAYQMFSFGSMSAGFYYPNLWLNRSAVPSATYVSGRPVSGDSAGNFQSAFISLYPLLLMNDYRTSASWQTHVLNLRLSHMAWTDDNAPRWNTVFSAGTTKGIWGGYRADAINNSPGNISTFTSLLALSAGTGAGGGFTPAAVAGYQAYRVGARQTWRTGAQMLYRRSSVDPAYLPNSAGMPDVALGGLGLAELLSPGSVQQVLVGGYRPCPCNLADITSIGGLPQPPDQQLTVDDIIDFVNAFSDGADWADVTGIGGPPVPPDGQLTVDDIIAFVNAFSDGC